MAPETGYDELAAELSTLGRGLAVPAPGPRLANEVMSRIADEPAPVEAPWIRRLWQRAVDSVAHRRRAAVALVAAVLVALLAAPPVRAAVADWFGFAGVIVRDDGSPGPTRAPPPPTVGATIGLDDARGLVGFTPVVPTALGSPNGVEVSTDRRLLSMSWTDGPDGTVRLDQFDGQVDYSFAKTSPGVEFTTVSGSTALWFDRPHEVVVLNSDGTKRTETARLAGHTLIWEHQGTALRLEGDVSRARAIEIAESVAGLR